MSNEQKQKKLGPTHLVTPPCRLAFPSLFTPRPKMKVPGTSDSDTKLTYQAVVLIPAEVDLAPFIDALRAAMIDKWGKVEKLPAGQNPLHSCDEKADIDGYEPGWHYLNLHSKYAPTVVDRARQPIIDPDLIYAGCWCRFHINAYAWTYGSKKGVSFGLNGVQFIRDDTRLDGRIGDAVFEALDSKDDLASGDDLFA